MDILGFNYSPELERIHEKLVDFIGDRLSLEDIRMDDDPRFRTAYGKHTRYSDKTITIKFNPEKSTEADIAHEYMHSLLQWEMFPRLVAFGGENREAKYLATHIEDSVIHPLINIRLEENGILIDNQRERTTLTTLDALSRHHSEESANIGAKQIKAFTMLKAYQCDNRIEAELEAALSEQLPKTFGYYLKYKNALKKYNLEDRMQCQKAMLKLVRVCDAQYENDSDEKPELMRRFYSEPVYLQEKILGKQTRDVFDIYKLNRSTYKDICIRYKREDRLVKTITYERDIDRDEEFERDLSLGRNSNCRQFMEEIDIAYAVV